MTSIYHDPYLSGEDSFDEEISVDNSIYQQITIPTEAIESYLEGIIESDKEYPMILRTSFHYIFIKNEKKLNKCLSILRDRLQKLRILPFGMPKLENISKFLSEKSEEDGEYYIIFPAANILSDDIELFRTTNKKIVRERWKSLKEAYKNREFLFTTLQPIADLYEGWYKKCIKGTTTI